MWLNAASGRLQGKKYLGMQPTGSGGEPNGIDDAAAVALSPASRTESVYVGGPEGYLYALNASNLAEWYTAPAGRVGGGGWSPVGVAPNGDVFVTSGPLTGNARLDHSESIVNFAPKTLTFLGQWQAPGAVNAKNGGKVLKDLTPGMTFGQSVFADGMLVTDNLSGIITWQPT